MKIQCPNGHEREDVRPRGICAVCGLHMRPKPKKYVRPKEENNG